MRRHAARLRVAISGLIGAIAGVVIIASPFVVGSAAAAKVPADKAYGVAYAPVCTNPNNTFDGNVSGSAYMIEYGKRGVVAFRAVFKVYNAEVSPGFEVPAAQYTVKSAKNPNDANNFYFEPSHMFT